MKYVFDVISTFIHLPVMFMSSEIISNNIFVFFFLKRSRYGSPISHLRAWDVYAPGLSLE